MAELAADDPRSIGRYRLLGRLGSGGMGRVYLARSEGGRTVAVKLIKAELAAEKEFRSRFRLEVEAARRVGQRWTAPVLDADTEAENPWIATGYIAGPSLEQVVSSRSTDAAGQAEGAGDVGPLPANTVRTLAYGLSSALLDIHGAGIIHRDLKPSNVLVTIDGPRVIDFGIARALDALPESTVTGTGVVVGSPSYMSPEQIRAQQVTPASDVFCMGSVLAYAATGRRPFGSEGGGGMHAVMFRIAAEEPDLEGVEEPLRGLIASCLAKDPAERPAPEDVIAAVQPISTGTASAPWLPATLIAELGRHAVQLLDTDTPPSGSGAPDVPGDGQPDEYLTAAVPGATTVEGAAGEQPGGPASATQDAQDAQAAQPDGSGPAPAPPRRPRQRIAVGALAVVAVAAVAFAASGAGLRLLGSDGDGGDRSQSSDIPEGYVGTWGGEVERGGEPTGQYRRFVISHGKIGEVVANSVSLGSDYECKSDGKLVVTGESIELDTKVVKSVPAERCSALGSHKLTRTSGGTLRWEAAGRNATLRRVPSPEKLPEEYLGTWQRQLAGGGTQRMTIEQVSPGRMSVDMVSEAPDEHCEAKADVVSVGGRDEPVRLGPPRLDRAASTGACVTGPAATLSVRNGVLQRAFAEGNGKSLAYRRVN